MNSIFKIRRAALGVALLCSALGAIAASNDGAVTNRVAVKYGDLDLRQPKGAQILYRRIARAAQQACSEPERADLTALKQYQYCYQTAVANAVYKVDARTLTALHLSKTQRASPG